MRKGLALLCFVATLLIFVVQCNADQGVAQVTGVKGAVTAKGQPCKMLSGVNAGDALDVQSGAEITLFFFKDKHREKIAGPAKFTVNAAGSDLPANKKVVTETTGALRAAGGSIAGLNTDQYGGSVKRGGGDLEPVRFVGGHKTASLSPTLRWSSVNGAVSYKIQVRAETSSPPIFEQTVKADTVAVDKPLQPGKTYYCSITAQDEDETTVGETHDTLEVLSDAKIKELDAAKKQFDATRESDPSSYLTLAAAYSAEGLSWDAIGVLQQLATAVPSSPYPHERMAALYRGLGLPDKAEAERKEADRLAAQ